MTLDVCHLFVIWSLNFDIIVIFPYNILYFHLSLILIINKMIQTAAASKDKIKGPNVLITYPGASQAMADDLGKRAAFEYPRVNDLVAGTVASITRAGVIVNIAGRLSGLVRGKELEDESGRYSRLRPGDEVEATVLESENEQGMLELSLRQAGHRKAWDYLQKLAEGGETVEAKIIDANKGGLLARVGNVEGFLPVSQLTVEHYPRVEGGDKNRILDRLRSYVGQNFRVRVITVKEQEAKLIVSEKEAHQEEQGRLMSQYQVGQEVEGKVTGVVDFGAFVEFGEGLEGLVHISELAWQRIDDPHDIIKVGGQVRAKIISLDGGRVSLSLKQLSADPWAGAAEKYKVGQEVSGKVLKINPYGAFVELDDDIHGLAHVSELSKEGAALKAGETRQFKILTLEPGAHRLGLGLISSK